VGAEVLQTVTALYWNHSVAGREKNSSGWIPVAPTRQDFPPLLKQNPSITPSVLRQDTPCWHFCWQSERAKPARKAQPVKPT
jgi:hypothetical protein